MVSKTKIRGIVLFLIVLMMMGCYGPCFAVESSQVGLRMNNGVTIDDVVGEGRYQDFDPQADIVVIDVAAKTFTWSDPELVTKDKQPIGVEIGYTVKRNPSVDGIKNMYRTYRAESLDDAALQTFINNKIPRAVKEVTARYTLDEMLGVTDGGELAPNRTVLQDEISKLLAGELQEANIILIDVGVNNIAPSADYIEALKRKANASIQAEIEKVEASTLGEQLKKEQATTAIELEKAQRQNLVELEKAKVLQQSPEALELKKLEIIGNAFSEKDKIFFISEGTDLTLFFNPGNSESPVVVPQPTTPVEQPAPVN